MNAGTKLICKIIDEKDASALVRVGVTESHFVSDVERNAYRFLKKYSAENRGLTPDFRTIIESVDGFNYEPNVQDTFEYLARELKSYAAKVSIFKVLQNQASEQFDKLSGIEFAEWLRAKTDDVLRENDIREKVGVSVKGDTTLFLDEYHDRQQGNSYKIYKSSFATINDEVGGYSTGSMYTWYGRSGRGKSIFTLEEAITAAEQGATVLVWAMEMTRYEVLARAYSSLSARRALFTANLNGVKLDAGFSNRELLSGSVSTQSERHLQDFLRDLNNSLSGNIIIRGVDDADFYKRTVDELESDILATKADVVVIDPFYYLDYEANTSKTSGGDAANTSKKLRHLAGRTKIVLHVITQAEESREERDSSGVRELRAPRRAEIKKTKAVLEDATMTLGIDTCDGEGVIELGKGRNGGEGLAVSVTYLPNYGIVREMPKGEEAYDHFSDEF